jgi:hypothetical protein
MKIILLLTLFIAANDTEFTNISKHDALRLYENSLKSAKRTKNEHKWLSRSIISTERKIDGNVAGAERTLSSAALCGNDFLHMTFDLHSGVEDDSNGKFSSRTVHECFLQNSNYSAIISMKGYPSLDLKSKAWYLKSFRLNTSADELSKRYKEYSKPELTKSYMLHRIQFVKTNLNKFITIDELLDSDTAEFSTNGNFLRLQSPLPDSSSTHEKQRRLSIVVDLSTNCSIVNATYNSINQYGPIESSTKNLLEDRDSGYSSKTIYNIRYKYKQYSLEETQTEDMDTEYVTIPSEIFRLSYYGLPEPEGVVWEKPTPVWVWLLTIASGFAGLAILFRWLQKRAARRAVAA